MSGPPLSPALFKQRILVHDLRDRKGDHLCDIASGINHFNFREKPSAYPMPRPANHSLAGTIVPCRLYPCVSPASRRKYVSGTGREGKTDLTRVNCTCQPTSGRNLNPHAPSHPTILPSTQNRCFYAHRPASLLSVTTQSIPCALPKNSFFIYFVSGTIKACEAQTSMG